MDKPKGSSHLFLKTYPKFFTGIKTLKKLLFWTELVYSVKEVKIIENYVLLVQNNE